MRKNKIGRNNACFCGSGKKYKNCCGSKEESNLNPIIINNELNQFHQGLLSFATDKYGDKIESQTRKFEKTEFQDYPEIEDIYRSGLFLWIISSLRFLRNNKTLIEAFYERVAVKIRLQARSVLKNWLEAKPSVFEVVSIDESKFRVTLLDIRTNITYSIPLLSKDEYIPGSIIIGTMVPYVNYNGFLITMLKLYGLDKNVLLDLIDKYHEESDGLSNQFPDFLTEVLLLVLKTQENSNTLYEKVTQLFTQNMANKGFDDSVIIDGIAVWNQYCREVQPTFKNSESYAAALEYYIQKHILKNERITQSQIADEYGVSAGTVSSNYRKLTSILL